jgi:hypothetical protein
MIQIKHIHDIILYNKNNNNIITFILLLLRRRVITEPSLGGYTHRTTGTTS